MADFKSTVVKGFQWSFIGQISNQVLGLLFSILLARLLVPEIFGLMAMVNVIMGFSVILLNFGFNAAIIQEDKVTNSLLSTVFWINNGIGMVLFVIFFFSAELIATFYDEPDLVFITKILSLQFVINAIGNVPRTLYSKNLSFRFLAIAEASATLVSGISAIMLAINGYGIEALLTQLLAYATVNNLLVLFSSEWRPSFIFSITELKKILSFSTYLFINQSLNYWVKNLDNLLIGKYLGSFSLGLYNKSYSFLTLPLNNITSAIGKVLFPSLSMIKDDKIKTKRVFEKTISAISLITFPMMIGLFVIADQFVLIILSERWIEAIPLIRIFCFLALSQSIGSLSGNIYMSQNRTDLLFRVGFIRKLILIGSIILGLYWGTTGVAISFSFFSIITSLVMLKIGGRLISLSLLDYWNCFKTNLYGSLIMGVLIFCFELIMAERIGEFANMVTQVILGIIIYVIFHELAKNSVYLEVKVLLLDRIKGSNK